MPYHRTAVKHIFFVQNDQTELRKIDYPIDIRNKFSLNWRFIVLNVLSRDSDILVPEVYERKKSKFIQAMEEALELSIECLHWEFAMRVEWITERFIESTDDK